MLLPLLGGLDRLKVSLLSFQLFGKGCNFFLASFVFSFESLGNIKSLLVGTVNFLYSFFKVCQFLFRVQLTNQWFGLLDDDKPSPGSKRHVFSEVTLDNLHQFTLIEFLLEYLTTNSAVCLSLKEANKLKDDGISSFFKSGKSASSEEYHSVTASVFFCLKIDFGHESSNTFLVIGGCSQFLGSKDHVSHLVVSVSDSVGETQHTNTNTFQYTITFKLVHNQWSFGFQWFLVSIWYNATDEVRFSDVQSIHQISQLYKVHR